MREQPHYLELLTEEFFMKHYVENRMSFPQIREMLLEQGHNVHVGTIHKYAKKMGIGRTISEGKRNGDEYALDYTVSYLCEPILESIDGFLAGDGSLYIEKRSSIESARLTCGLQYEEFCQYLMSCFSVYSSNCKQHKNVSMSSGTVWTGRTKFHPDLYQQYLRWYPENAEGKRIKSPPKDIRITPKSVMLWYLGDGSVVSQNDIVTIRLSTDAFTKEEVEFLAGKLTEKGIDSYRNNDNRVQVRTAAVPAFFDFIGRESPVECYKYKFDLPEWRFEAKRMSQVAEELGIDYQQLAYMVKIGKIPCYRIKNKGRPRFLPEHISVVKEIFNK
jgi:LAGLIDADG DNA endonuclease family